MKPILFNTEMVQAILEGRKTVTRRAIKTRRENTHIEVWGEYPVEVTNGEIFMGRDKTPPYKKDDILYVRETWAKEKNSKRYLYRADKVDYLYKELHSNWKWKPSIHMPKEAARIFLRVTNVSIARLQDITEGQAKAEGAIKTKESFSAVKNFQSIWDSTIKRADHGKYSWEVNPWVWVIEFERIAKKDAI